MLKTPRFIVTSNPNPHAQQVVVEHLTYVVIDSELSEPELNLANKILSAIDRNQFEIINLNTNPTPNYEFKNLMTEQNIETNLKLENINFRNLPLTIYFSDKANESDLKVFNSSLKVTTHSLKKLSDQSNLKSELWSILKRLK